MAEKLANPRQRDGYGQMLSERYAEMRRAYAEKQSKPAGMSIDEARAHKPNLF